MKFDFFKILALVAVICLFVIAGSLLSISISLSKGIDVNLDYVPILNVDVNPYGALDVNLDSVPTLYVKHESSSRYY